MLDDTAAGLPTCSNCWATISTRKAQNFLAKLNINVSHVTVKKCIEELHYSLQSNRRFVGEHDPKGKYQRRLINRAKKMFIMAGCPVISVDCKKKENIGNYYNQGKSYCPKGSPTLVNSYDFVDTTVGKAIPYGVYDPVLNKGFISLGCSADTAEFAVNTIKAWYANYGCKLYPNTKHLLILADGGGSNSSRSRLWKKCLSEFADTYKLTITVLHFAPGDSKYNPIEHKLFSYISMNWRGHPLSSMEIMKEFICHTTTNADTPLNVDCQLDTKKYQTGIKVDSKLIDTMIANKQLRKGKCHKDWIYRIYPNRM